MTTITPQYNRVTVIADGAQVVVTQQGRTLLNLPWDAALALSQALYNRAKAAEEIAKALEIVEDQAVLFQNGMPLQLSSNKNILGEATRKAGSIPSLESFGKVKLIKHRNLEAKP